MRELSNFQTGDRGTASRNLSVVSVRHVQMTSGVPPRGGVVVVLLLHGDPAATSAQKLAPVSAIYIVDSLFHALQVQRLRLPQDLNKIND